MTQARVYNAVVWTEAALAYCSQSTSFRDAVGPLHASTKTQLVLAPGILESAKVAETFKDFPTAPLVLAWDMELGQSDPDGAPYYFTDLLRHGISDIQAVAKARSNKAKLGPLGALIPAEDLPVDEAQNSRPQDEPEVGWLAVEAGSQVFLGPDLVQLATLILVHYGVDPERTLWLFSTSQQSSENSIDVRVLRRGWNRPGSVPPVHVGRLKIPRPRQSAIERRMSVEDQVEDLAGVALKKQLADLASVIVTKPIRLHHDCALLRSRHIIRFLRDIRPDGDRNRDAALTIARQWAEKSGAGSETEWFVPIMNVLHADGAVFDNKSGAIAFDSYQWELDVQSLETEPWRGVVQYFNETIADPWQTDRPNLANRLETPTQTILRGENYYNNMANVPPLDRIVTIAKNFEALLQRFDFHQLFRAWTSPIEWKLALAMCDQVRNYVLQLNWFAYQVDRHARSPKRPIKCGAEALSQQIRDLTDAAVGLYYSALLLNRDSASRHLSRIMEIQEGVLGHVRECLEAVRRLASSEPDMSMTQAFVRRWREADLPGESLLTAALATEFCRQSGITNPVAVGISWGGIELPLAFRHVWMLSASSGSSSPRPLVADYSHYRKHIDSGELPYNGLAPGLPTTPPQKEEVLIFDDNILTGQTIERVHDDLLARQCVVRAVFVTRISGGRRYGQMRMRQHGVLNPELIAKGMVRGFLGETAYALTWSREEKRYANPIGIFSLPRRRILELLHANSSVERYDREGF